MSNSGVLYWITGLSGAGKTTIGNRLYYELKRKNDNVVLLDGDILKNIVSDNQPGYSNEDRKKRAFKYAQICEMLASQGLIVICCTIAMYDEVREWNRKNNKAYVEVFLEVPLSVLQKRDQKGMYSKQKNGNFENLAGVNLNVEFPKNPDVTIENDGKYTIKECVDMILNYKITYSSDFDRDVEYWNRYYSGKDSIETPSLFAQYVNEKIELQGELLDLGCGNARDSLFFEKKGLHVTAIDASDFVIENLKKKYSDKNINFICDDFVCSKVLYEQEYNYCYSRFSLHAINEEQETELINNVYKCLKENGRFFIEVRSIHDEIFGKGKLVGRNAYVHEGHYRRFIDKEELEEKLSHSGFTIEYSEEKRDFAPLGNSNPLIIRIIASKCKRLG